MKFDEIEMRFKSQITALCTHKSLKLNNLNYITNLSSATIVVSFQFWWRLREKTKQIFKCRSFVLFLC